jgi:predicted RNA-binding protein Jag
MLETIKNLSNTFFEKLWVSIDSLEVLEQENNIFLIKINSKESPLLIWTNGKTLESILSILKLIIRKHITENIKIHIEINDYLKSKDDKLKVYIISKIKIVEESWKDLKLPFFCAYDRKKIHSIVSEYGNNKIYTKSFWEWLERRLYICKLEEKITIDIDGNDI